MNKARNIVKAIDKLNNMSNMLEVKIEDAKEKELKVVLAGPLMDRMDLFIEVPAVKYEKLTADSGENQSQAIRERIEKAREKQKQRFTISEDNKILTNSEMNIPEIKKYCAHDEQSQNLLKKYVDSGKLSARGYHRILKVSRTIADLAGSENIKYEHIAEALMYRVRD